MGETIIQLIPYIIGSAIVPVQIMLIILLLNRPRQGLVLAILLVAGITAVRLVQGVIFGWILAPEPGEAGGKSPIVSILLVVLGILLLITAYKQWRNEDDPDGPPPKWMVMLDTLTPAKAFLMGAGLVLISGKFWVFTLSALGVITEAQLGQPTSTVTYMLYLLLAQSLLLIAILMRIIIPGQSKSILESISAWLTRHNRVIVLVVSLVFGCLFFFQGVSGLLSK